MATADLGSIVGLTAILFVVFALAVALGKVLADGRQELGAHSVGAALVWLAAAVIHKQVGAPVAAYFVARLSSASDRGG